MFATVTRQKPRRPSREAVKAEARRCDDRAAYFRRQGDAASAERQEAKARELRASLATYR
jgi:hypothetical protein